MRKVKILYTIPNFDTAGSGKVVYDLVNGLDKNVYEPEICCFHNKGGFFKEVKSLGVPIHIFPFATTLKPYHTLLFRVFKISGFFRKHKFDLIHSWHWSSDITEPLAAKLAGIPWVYTKKAMSWGSPRLWKIRSQLAKKILVLNQDMAPRFFKSLEHKVKLIYLGVDVNKYEPQPKVRNTPLGHQFSKNDFILTTVANLVPIKGIEYLIDAVNIMKDDAVKLLIVGNHRNKYGQELKRLNTNKNIIFIDKQLDVRPYHAVADVFVIPTKTSWEGLPVAPLEAMSSQCVVIGSCVEGVKEVLEDYPEFMFPPQNSQEIAQKLLELKAMGLEERNMLAQQMRQTVLNKFSLKTCLDNHSKIYLQLLRK